MYMNLYRYRVNRDDKYKDMQFQRIIFLEINIYSQVIECMYKRFLYLIDRII